MAWERGEGWRKQVQRRALGKEGRGGTYKEATEGGLTRKPGGPLGSLVPGGRLADPNRRFYINRRLPVPVPAHEKSSGVQTTGLKLASAPAQELGLCKPFEHQLSEHEMHFLYLGQRSVTVAVGPSTAPPTTPAKPATRQHSCICSAQALELGLC